MGFERGVRDSKELLGAVTTTEGFGDSGLGFRFNHALLGIDHDL